MMGRHRCGERSTAHTLQAVFKHAAIVIVLLTLTGLAWGQETVEGDAQAWQEVLSAYGKLRTLKTYRMRRSGYLGIHPYVVEVVNPDRVRITDGEAEYIIVGSEQRGRWPKNVYFSGWVCLPSAYVVGTFPIGALLTDYLERFLPPLPPLLYLMSGAESSHPRTAYISAPVAANIDGVKTSQYMYWLRISPLERNPYSVRERIYVSADGLLRRTELLDIAEKAVDTITYTNHDAPITIQSPRCR